MSEELGEDAFRPVVAAVVDEMLDPVKAGRPLREVVADVQRHHRQP